MPQVNGQESAEAKSAPVRHDVSVWDEESLHCWIALNGRWSRNGRGNLASAVIAGQWGQAFFREVTSSNSVSTFDVPRPAER